MSDAISIDPARGFVALPASIFDLEISPGAFRALTVLCNLADDKGYSWASLEQLAEWVRRARSSVSGYLAELKEAGLVSTETQTRSNGANYRLKVKVLFWAQWVQVRKKPASHAPQKAERRVQPVERPTKVKHKPKETHHKPPRQMEPHQVGPAVSDPAASEAVNKIYQAWKRLTDGQPYGAFSGPASPALLKDTRELLSTQPISKPASPAQVSETLGRIWSDLDVTVPQEDVGRMVKTCLARGFSQARLAALDSDIRQHWEAHWRKPPAPKQFEAQVERSGSAVTAETQLKLIQHDYRKYREISA